MRIFRISYLVKKWSFKTQVKTWLTQQNVYCLHKPMRYRFKTRKVPVAKMDDQWLADSVDIQKNKTFNKN